MTIGIIPARMASTRFPGKPLAVIQNMPMLGHCYFRTKMSRSLEEVYIATCDDEIDAYAKTIGAKCIMTSESHERASDRIAEAMLKIEKDTGQRHEIVVLIQGDEPMIFPEMIDDAVAGLEDDPSALVVNGVAPILSAEEFEDPNEIKVVVDQSGDAIYFSREPIPSRSKWNGDIPMQKQICIIPFRRDYLLEFNNTPQTPLEIIESIDMLRVLETGGRVKMVKMIQRTLSVDTPEDLQRVDQLMAGDLLLHEYHEYADD
jgi:3-deoxy-manno-octulosonate cytidylyltransferase (CMP-KDO synthetase)